MHVSNTIPALARAGDGRSIPLVGDALPPIDFIVRSPKHCVTSSHMMRANGFTIIELMFVLSIAAILSVVAMPSMDTFLKNNRLKGEAFRLVKDIQFARGEAVKRKVPVILCGSAAPAVAPKCDGDVNVWTMGYLVFASGDGNNTFDPLNNTHRLLRIGLGTSSDVTLKTNASSNDLEFNPDGTTNEGATVNFAICDIRDAAFGRQINVPGLGRPKLVKAPPSCSP